MRREGGRRIGLCSRIRLSAPVVRSPAPPSRDTPRPPPPYVLRFTGFLHSTTPPPARRRRGEREREGRWRKSDDRSIGRPTSDRNRVDFENLPRFEGTLEVLALVGRVGNAWKDGERGEESEREVGLEFRRMDFFYTDFWKFSFSTVEILKKILLELKISRGKIRGRKYKNRKMVDGREFGEMGRIGPPPPREPTYYGNKYRSGRSAVVLIAVVNPPRAGGTDKPGPFPRSRGNILLRAPSPLNIANA